MWGTTFEKKITSQLPKLRRRGVTSALCQRNPPSRGMPESSSSTSGTHESHRGTRVPRRALFGRASAAGRVGDFSSAIGLTASRVDDGPSVGRQLQRGNRHAVVARVVCDLPGLKIGSVRDPHVALGPSREHPCDSSSTVACIFDGHKIRGKWRTQNLFQREGARWRLRGTSHQRGPQQQDADAKPGRQISNFHARQST